MTDDRRAFWIAAHIYHLLWLAGSVGCATTLAAPDLRGPHTGHSGQLARADDAPLVPIPAVPDVAAPVPDLRFEPTTAKPGTPVKLLFTPPDASLVTVNWQTFDFGVEKINGTTWHVWPSAGENVAAVEVLWVDGDTIRRVLLTATHTSGEPPPPKPLKELAGKDAPALADFYGKFAGKLSLVETSAEFWSTHDAGLAILKLEGHGARDVLSARLEPVAADPFDAVKVEAELRAVVKELGAPAPGPDPPPVVVTPGTAVTYVYEKDDGGIPSGVSVGLDRLNRERQILATPFEEDTTDGDGDTPDQYKAALAAAQQAGLPALVVTTGDTVLKVVPDPRTAEQVFEAIAP